MQPVHNTRDNCLSSDMDISAVDRRRRQRRVPDEKRRRAAQAQVQRSTAPDDQRSLTAIMQMRTMQGSQEQMREI